MLECPSIQITTISPEDDTAPAGSNFWDTGGGWDRERLYLPLMDPFCYREGSTGAGSLSPSPASSPSSRGWLSPASSCDSLLVEEEDLNEATSHFCLSPSSRPTSPGGKKRRNFPLASPCTSRRSSYSEDHSCNQEEGDSSSQSQGPNSGFELSIPQKTRKTSLEQVSWWFVDLKFHSLFSCSTRSPWFVSSRFPPGRWSKCRLQPIAPTAHSQSRCSREERPPPWAWTTCLCPLLWAGGGPEPAPIALCSGYTMCLYSIPQ